MSILPAILSVLSIARLGPPILQLLLLLLRLLLLLGLLRQLYASVAMGGKSVI